MGQSPNSLPLSITAGCIGSSGPPIPVEEVVYFFDFFVYIQEVRGLPRLLLSDGIYSITLLGSLHHLYALRIQTNVAFQYRLQ